MTEGSDTMVVAGDGAAVSMEATAAGTVEAAVVAVTVDTQGDVEMGDSEPAAPSVSSNDGVASAAVGDNESSKMETEDDGVGGVKSESGSEDGAVKDEKDEIFPADIDGPAPRRSTRARNNPVRYTSPVKVKKHQQQQEEETAEEEIPARIAPPVVPPRPFVITGFNSQLHSASHQFYMKCDRCHADLCYSGTARIIRCVVCHKLSVPGRVDRATAYAPAPLSLRLQCEQWTCMQVCVFIHSLRLGRLVPYMDRHCVDGKFLLSLTPNDIRFTLGITDNDDVAALHAATNILRGTPTAPEPATAAQVPVQATAAPIPVTATATATVSAVATTASIAPVQATATATLSASTATTTATVATHTSVASVIASPMPATVTAFSSSVPSVVMASASFLPSIPTPVLATATNSAPATAVASVMSTPSSSTSVSVVVAAETSPPAVTAAIVTAAPVSMPPVTESAVMGEIATPTAICDSEMKIENVPSSTSTAAVASDTAAAPITDEFPLPVPLKLDSSS